MDHCKEITRLVSEGLDRELRLAERLRVRLHLLICHGCSLFEKQISTLRGMSRAFLGRLPDE